MAPSIQSLSSWYRSIGSICTLEADRESSEIILAQFAIGFLVHGHVRQVPESASIFIQLPFLHFEGVEFCIGLFLAHNILEGLGEVIDHVVPDMLVPIGIEIYASLDVSIGPLGFGH